MVYNRKRIVNNWKVFAIFSLLNLYTHTHTHITPAELNQRHFILSVCFTSMIVIKFLEIAWVTFFCELYAICFFSAMMFELKQCSPFLKQHQQQQASVVSVYREKRSNKKKLCYNAYFWSESFEIRAPASRCFFLHAVCQYAHTRTALYSRFFFFLPNNFSFNLPYVCDGCQH